MTMNTMNTSTQLRKVFTTAILGALAAGFAGLSAGAGMIESSVTVKYGDLNLSNPLGATALYSRIVAAAHQVCDSSNDLASQVRAHACLNKAISEAVTKVGHPGLIAVYIEKNRQPLPVTVAAR
jgi:UrcA family protein